MFLSLVFLFFTRTVNITKLIRLALIDGYHAVDYYEPHSTVPEPALHAHTTQNDKVIHAWLSSVAANAMVNIWWLIVSIHPRSSTLIVYKSIHNLISRAKWTPRRRQKSSGMKFQNVDICSVLYFSVWLIDLKFA